MDISLHERVDTIETHIDGHTKKLDQILDILTGNQFDSVGMIARQKTIEHQVDDLQRRRDSNRDYHRRILPGAYTKIVIGIVLLLGAAFVLTSNFRETFGLNWTLAAPSAGILLSCGVVLIAMGLDQISSDW